MTGEIYGHISRRLMSDLERTLPDGSRLYAVNMVKAVFSESFQYADHTFYIHQYASGKWDVIEKFTGLSACQHGDLRKWDTKEKAVEMAMENLRKYEREGRLKERLLKSYNAWLHIHTSLQKVSPIRLKILKKI